MTRPFARHAVLGLGLALMGLGLGRSLLSRWSHALDLFFQEMQLVRWAGGPLGGEGLRGELRKFRVRYLWKVGRIFNILPSTKDGVIFDLI